MQHSEPAPRNSASQCPDESNFGNIEFQLRTSNVFSLEEDEDAEIGFKPPKMTLLKQSLSPLHSCAQGRAGQSKNASVRMALDSYFARVGWSKRRKQTAPADLQSIDAPNFSPAQQAPTTASAEAA